MPTLSLWGLGQRKYGWAKVVEMGGDAFFHPHHLKSLLAKGLTLSGGDGGDVFGKTSWGGVGTKVDDFGRL
jgi:hypothetical protein